MKKTVLFIGLVLGFLTGFSQAELRLTPQTLLTDKNGGTIQKGDTVIVALNYKNNIHQDFHRTSLLK